MTGQQLKNSILQMAVQGKLVPQDPNDEPASVLLERIRKEKEQLIKDGKIKKEKNPSYIFRGADNLPYEKVGKNEPVCIADEVPFEIPESWEWVRVKSCTELYNGKAFKPSDWTDQGLPIVRIQNLNNVCAPFNYYDKFVDEDVHLYGGELLFAWSGTPGTSFGAHIWQNKEAVLNQHIFKLLFDENSLYKPFYMYALNERVGSLIKSAHGSAGLQHITRKVFESTLIPLPPFTEQKRIAAKINTLMPIIQQYSEIYSCIEELNNYFPDRIKKSILQEAVQGKLVPQDPSDEPASVLLEHIRTEKERLIKEGKIKCDKQESVIFRRDNSHYEKRGSDEICIDNEIPFELPNGWCWCRFSTICYKLTDGSHNPPPKRSKGVRVISARNIKNGRILFTDEDRLCDQNGFNKENPRTQISKGDVILGIIGGSIGNTAIYGYDEPVIAQRSIAIFGSLINNKYMKLLLDSPLFQQQFNSKSNGTAQGGIYLGELANMLVPLPPVNEQNKILASISSLENKFATM